MTRIIRRPDFPLPVCLITSSAFSVFHTVRSRFRQLTFKDSIQGFLHSDTGFLTLRYEFLIFRYVFSYVRRNSVLCLKTDFILHRYVPFPGIIRTFSSFRSGSSTMPSGLYSVSILSASARTALFSGYPLPASHRPASYCLLLNFRLSVYFNFTLSFAAAAFF